MKLLPVLLLSAAVIATPHAARQNATPAPSGSAKPLIDNPRVTIQDVTWTAGQKWPVQEFALDTLVIPVTPVSLKLTAAGGKSSVLALKPGDAAHWAKGTRHEVESTSAGRTIVAQFKDQVVKPYENTSGLGPAFPRPRVKKLFESDRIVVWDYTWVKGEPTPQHFHDKDLMIVYLADGAIQSVTPDGKASPNAFKFSEVRFNPGNRAHYEEYVSGDGPRAIITELKK